MEFELGKRPKLILRACHMCGEVNESERETERCSSCNKPFLPLNYFGKVHARNSTEFQALFAEGHELKEEDLIRGIYVLW